MHGNRVLTFINIVFPLIGMGLMIFYDVCDTSCSYLQGTFMGIDLKIIGILFMASLLVILIPPVTRYEMPVNHLRTVMLSSAVGAEILLVRFQIEHETFCQFCLVFGLCVVVLFVANFQRMNRLLAMVSLLAGIGAFILFFKGSTMPLYSLLFFAPLI